VEPFALVNNSSLLTIREWESRCPNLVAGFTTRIDGNSVHPYDSFNCALHVGDDHEHVIANRQSLCNQLGFKYDKWTCAEQVHGNQVAIIQQDMVGKGRISQEDTISGIDGLVTSEKGVLLTSFYADCVPLLFLSVDKEVIGIAHAGWKGTAAAISQKMVDVYVNRFQSELNEIQVMIGPSIGGCCYEVDQRVVEAMKSALLGWESHSYLKEKANGKYLINLKEINRLLLLQSGIKPENIQVSEWCTSCRTDLFYSYRGEGGRTGRMTAYMGWREER
jgi:polyphenol oxidase